MQILFNENASLYICDSIVNNSILVIGASSLQANVITLDNNKLCNQQQLFLQQKSSLPSSCQNVYAICQMVDDTNFIATGSDDKTVKIWNILTCECVNTLEGHHSYVKTIIALQEPKLIASASHDATIRIWNYKK